MLGAPTHREASGETQCGGLRAAMRAAASRGNELLGLPWLHRRHSQAQEAPQPKAMALGPGCRWELVTLENTSIYKTVSSSKHFMEPWRPGHAPPLGQTAAKHFLLVVLAFQWEPGDVNCRAQLCRLRDATHRERWPWSRAGLPAGATRHPAY